jgi:hypothetical protein
MATQRDRREAAEILRRIVATLPDPTPVQVAFLMGQASALDGLASLGPGVAAAGGSSEISRPTSGTTDDPPSDDDEQIDHAHA